MSDFLVVAALLSTSAGNHALASATRDSPPVVEGAIGGGPTGGGRNIIRPLVAKAFAEWRVAHAADALSAHDGDGARILRPALRGSTRVAAGVFCQDDPCRAFVRHASQQHFVPGGHEEPYLIGRSVVMLTPWEADRERQCLAIISYAEARGEGSEGMAAVMWVIANRLALSNDAAAGPCEIALRGGFEAISSMAFAHQIRELRRGGMPGPIATENMAEQHALQRALTLAYFMVGGGMSDDSTHGATHFWSPSEQGRKQRFAPSWAARFVRTAAIGAQLFYRPSAAGPLKRAVGSGE